MSDYMEKSQKDRFENRSGLMSVGTRALASPTSSNSSHGEVHQREQNQRDSSHNAATQTRSVEIVRGRTPCFNGFTIASAFSVSPPRSLVRLNELREGPLSQLHKGHSQQPLNQMPALSSTRQWDSWWEQGGGVGDAGAAAAGGAATPSQPRRNMVDTMSAITLQACTLQGTSWNRPGISSSSMYEL